MLFHTWAFALFLLVVLPVFFALRRTRLWLPWLTVASYFFYGWWNPYYLVLVFYSTLLDFCLVALMDHCPVGERVSLRVRSREWFGGGEGALASGEPGRDAGANRRDTYSTSVGVLRVAFLAAALGTVACLGMMVAGPRTLRPTMGVLGMLVLLMALGALFSSRRIWLGISLVNNLALLLFFKYARFVVENLNNVFSGFHLSMRLSDPST